MQPQFYILFLMETFSVRARTLVPHHKMWYSCIYTRTYGKGEKAMLKILVGRACSGKSARVLQAIHDLGDASQQILLVPEHASHAAEADVCRTCGDTATRHVEALTFKLLARRVLSLTGGLCDYALDAGGKLLTIERALHETATQLRVYKRPSRRVAFLDGLSRIFDEFSAYETSPELLFDCAAKIGGAQGDKLHDLALLYGVYSAKLQNGGEDLRDRMSKLAENLAQSGYIDGKDIFLDGFSYFNAQEERILAVMLRRAHSVTVTLLGEHGSDSEVFAACDRTRERLVRLASECGARCEIEWLAPQSADSALAHIERHFFGENKTWEGDAENICIRCMRQCAAKRPHAKRQPHSTPLRRRQSSRRRQNAVPPHFSMQAMRKLPKSFCSFGASSAMSSTSFMRSLVRVSSTRRSSRGFSHSFSRSTASARSPSPATA